jgi:hypothetical protein
MTKPTDVFLRGVETSTQRIDYRVPIKFGGRVVVDVVLLDVTVDVETRDGRRARGIWFDAHGQRLGMACADASATRRSRP